MQILLICTASALAGAAIGWGARWWLTRPRPWSATASRLGPRRTLVHQADEHVRRKFVELQQIVAAQVRRTRRLCSRQALPSPAGETLQRLATALQGLDQELAGVSQHLDRLAVDLDVLLSEARTDALTGLWNRRALDENMLVHLAIAQRYGSPFSVVLLDIDHFKEINDRFGHRAGDEVLRQFGPLLQAGTRSADLVTRYGGEEFALLLPQTDAQGALVIAERIRQMLEEQPFEINGQAYRLQVSAGVAEVRVGDDAGTLLGRADEALYRSKAAGRNCVHVASAGCDLPSPPQLESDPSIAVMG